MKVFRISFREALYWCRTWFLRLFGQASRRKIAQPEHIAWEALQPESETAHGFKRRAYISSSAWNAKTWSAKLGALSGIAKHLAWIFPLVLLELVRRGGLHAMHRAGADKSAR